jgi:hypothetical protein
MIKRGMQCGMRKLLRSPAGRQLEPELRNLLQAGLLEVRLHRCSDLDVSGILRRPRIKAVVRVGDQQTKETVPFKVSKLACFLFLASRFLFLVWVSNAEHQLALSV